MSPFRVEEIALARSSRASQVSDDGLELKIVNLVTTAELNQPVDLAKLEDEGGFSYDPSVYKCAYFKDRKTRSKVSIFATGKLISIGATSLPNAKSAMKTATKRMAELGMITIPKLTPKIRNVVALADLGGQIDLDSISRKLRHVVYEPEQFPGLLYFPEELDGASITLFASGKVIIAGLKSLEFVESAKIILRKLRSLL